MDAFIVQVCRSYILQSISSCLSSYQFTLFKFGASVDKEPFLKPCSGYEVLLITIMR